MAASRFISNCSIWSNFAFTVIRDVIVELAENGKFESAKEIYDQMKQPDASTVSALVKSAATQRQHLDTGFSMLLEANAHLSKGLVCEWCCYRCVM